MYLSEPKLADIVKKQFRFKLNSHASYFSTFVFMQIGALILTLTGSSYNFTQLSSISVSIVELSNNMNVVLSMVWALFLGITLTTAVRRNEAFSFVTTRLSNQLANLLFILTASLFAGVIAALTGPVLKLFGILRYGEIVVNSPGIIAAPGDFFLRIITSIAYVLLFFLIGYAISSLVQLHKAFIGIFIILFIMFTSMTDTWNGAQYIGDIFEFFSNEQSLLLFLLKISGTVLGLFTISVFITNRLEVRN